MKILIAVIIIFSALMITASLLVKKIIVRQLEQKLNQQVRLESVSFGLPFSLNLKRLEVGDFTKAELITAAPRLAELFAKKVFFNRLTLKNGRYIYSANIKSQPAQKFTIISDNINADILELALPPLSSRAKFNLSLDLAGIGTANLGSVSASGWIDPEQKDMEAVLQVKSLEAAYFAPYYGDFISQRRISSAKVDFTANLKAANNDLTANCHFELSDLMYQDAALQENKLPNLDLLKNTLDLFIDPEGKLRLDFVINTKLDNPHISSDELKRVILKAAAKKLASQSPEILIQKVATTIEQFEDFGKQMKDVFSSR